MGGGDKFFIACAGVVLLLLFVLFGFGAGVLATLVGFCYPAFSSFKALEDGAADRQRFWLSYPQTRGAETIYNGLLKEAIKPYVDTIDGGLDAATAQMKEAMSTAGDAASQLA